MVIHHSVKPTTHSLSAQLPISLPFDEDLVGANTFILWADSEWTFVELVRAGVVSRRRPAAVRRRRRSGTI